MHIHTHICVCSPLLPLLLADVFIIIAAKSSESSSSSQWRIGVYGGVEQSNVFVVICSKGRKTPFRITLAMEKEE
jgi:hypothetical protein